MFTLDPNAITTARAALLLLALPDAHENVERLRIDAIAAVRRTYGDLDRPGVTVGELRRAAFAVAIPQMTMRELADAAARLDD